MKRTEAIKKLRTFANALKERGATSLYLFGSTVRNQANSKSDLDLFLDYDPRSKFNAFDLVAAKRMLRLPTSAVASISAPSARQRPEKPMPTS